MGVERADRPPAADAAPGAQLASEDAADREDFPRPPTTRSVGFTVSSLGFAVANRFAQTLAPIGLEPREFALLRTVGSAAGRTQQAIATGMGVPASRMVALVDALEARGLLERRHNPRDRRARELHLTHDGAQLLETALERAVALESELCAGMDEHEREQLLELLQRVGAALGVPPGVHAAGAHASAGD